MAIHTLLQRMPGLKLAESKWRYRPLFGFRALEELPVTLNKPKHVSAEKSVSPAENGQSIKKGSEHSEKSADRRRKWCDWETTG